MVGGREEIQRTAEMLVAGEMIRFEISGLCGLFLHSVL
jgi:hypothetical protein